MYRQITGLALGALLALTTAPVLATGKIVSDRTNQLIIRMEDDGLRRIQSVGRDEPVPELKLPDGRELIFKRRFNGNGMVVELPEAVSLEQAQLLADQLAGTSGVLSVQPDKRMYPALVPNDPEYNPAVGQGQWYLYDSTSGINMQPGWDLETGSASVVIAVLDTGILTHADLNPARVLPGYDFITNVATANDGDGRDADPSDPGDATVDNECDPGVPGEDSSWHGLSVSGVMVAESDNALDIAGIDFAARLLPVRVLGKCGGLISDITDAIRWAAGLSVAGVADNPTPADVINLSLSGAGACSPDEQSAIDAAVAAGAVVVVAAGNEGGDVAGQSPANCNNVVVVGAIDRDGSRASYMNIGEEVDLSAPGGDGTGPAAPAVLTLFNTGTTAPAADALALIQGTSYTTAQVSAVAALMVALNGSLNPAQIEEILRRTTRTFPDASCTLTTCGLGVLDAAAALAAAADPSAIFGASANTEGGSSGCTLGQRASVSDPLLLLLALIAAAGLRRRGARAGSRVRMR